MKKLFAVAALAGFVGLTACESREETLIIEEPVVEQPAPVIVEPTPPMTTDPLLTDTMQVGETTDAPGTTGM